VAASKTCAILVQIFMDGTKQQN